MALYFCEAGKLVFFLEFKAFQIKEFYGEKMYWNIFIPEP
jgi:hypothetical protein